MCPPNAMKENLIMFSKNQPKSNSFRNSLLFKETFGPIMLVRGTLILLGLVLGSFPQRKIEEVPE